ncbi:hypothetical protein NM208_g11970 [Fusarium decemcellulare]|uniref:Uncharacterized protein n=1 Tax=Fusarium decemcellulare TaxID=57161 RepID=A0ACC1RRQ3_9HYPO|nr:hypothetical protein NM208_g11970 [Fusarium decemcellulare]
MASTQGEARIAMRDKHYNEHCEIQEAAMQAGLNLLPSYSNNNNLVVIDYGCAQGANSQPSSIEPLKKIISTLPDGATVSLIFEDTSFNDFGSLGKTVGQHFSASQTPKNVLVAPSMVPLGFYQQVIPNGHADLGLSWSSLNYLESIPSVSLDASAPPAEFVAARQKAFSAAGQKDLIKLLKLRAKEIRSGGYLIAAIGGQKPAGEEKPSSPGFQPLQAAMMRMVGEGKLTPAELMQSAMFPSHERTPDEIRAALEDPEVAPLWEVEVLEPKLIEHPAWAIYQAAVQADESQKTDALRKYARTILVNLVSAGGWFWADVFRKSRGEDWDADAFLEELTNAAIEECVEKFGDLKAEIWYNYVKLRRTDNAA